jgi:nucleoside-diphosphate-sugar epimerase
MKRVLVTGASGFIGRHTVPLLSAAGYEVHTASFPEVDLLNAGARRDVVARVRPTHLLHLAWHVPPGKYWTSLENVRWLQASLDLVTEFAGQGGERVVTAGTCAEYNWSPGGVCRETGTPLEPASLYGASKDALRRIQESLAGQFGFRSCWGRVFFPYGPGEPAGRLVPSVIDSLRRGEPARCSHGRQVRDFLHVADVARAFVVLLESDCMGAVNIGSGAGVSIAEVVRTIGDLFGRHDLIRLGELPARAGEPNELVADTTVLRSLGFAPQFDLRSGLADTMERRPGRV